MEKGDVVICLDGDNCRGLFEGDEYEVLSVSYLARMIKVESATGELYYKISRFKEKAMEFEFGEEIEVEGKDLAKWRKRRFVGMSANGEYVCISNINPMVKGGASCFEVTLWREARAIASPTHTLSNGREVSEATIIEALKHIGD